MKKNGQEFYGQKYDGKSLRNWVNSQSESISKIAESVGVSRQQLYQYFDKESLSQRIVSKITARLGVTVEDIWAKDANTTIDSAGSLSMKRPLDSRVDLNGGKILRLIPLIGKNDREEFLPSDLNAHFLATLSCHTIVVDSSDKGNYYAFEMEGGNMDDGTSNSIIPGSVLTGREIGKELWNSRFQFVPEKEYVFVHREGILISRLGNIDIEKGKIGYRSLNPSSLPDGEVDLADCRMIFKIVSVCKYL